jgi:hypothetical protein
MFGSNRPFRATPVQPPASALSCRRRPVSNEWRLNGTRMYLYCSLFIADPPYFLVRPKSFYQLEPMQTVVMPCVAEGDPMPTIVWRRVRIHAALWRMTVCCLPLSACISVCLSLQRMSILSTVNNNQMDNGDVAFENDPLSFISGYGGAMDNR